MSGTIVFDFELDGALLLRAFDSANDIGAITLVHTELNRALDHVLAKLYPNPKKLGASRVGPKIERLEALGIGGPRIAVMKQIDDVRNAFAHRGQEDLFLAT